MKQIRAWLFIITVICVFTACRKEYSFENGGTRIADTSGDTCNTGSMIESNIASGRVEYAYKTGYDAAHVATEFQILDSANNSIDKTFSFSYSPGRVQVDADQYFVTAADGKVSEFHGYEFPEDATSERFNVKYSYNPAGQLTKRVEEYNAIPGVVSFQMDYAYTGNNLTSAEIKMNNGLIIQKFIDVKYEYETSKTIKNFIYLHPVAPEIFYFQSAINAGSMSANPVKKITTTYLNFSTGRDSISVSNFVNYRYDAKNQVTGFELTGGDLTLNGLHAGRKYTFNYNCY